MQYAYSKRRSEFGRACYFAERPTEVLVDIEPDQNLHSQYVRVNPYNRASETAGSLSEHEAGTEYIEMKDNGINHEEGGWPKDINANEIDHTNRYRKKLEKEESYATQMSILCKVMEHYILQNNATNIYQEYFEDCDLLQYHDPTACAKNVTTLRDCEIVSRPACHLSWHPDGPEKLAVAHAPLDFQSHAPIMSINSYIWRTDDMFNPDVVLHPSSPAVCIKYCPKDGNLLAGGQYNGQVVFWDLRRSCFPTEKSALEVSHRDPVYDVVWINSKTGFECFSTATDGKVMWWDLRNMKEPEDQMYMDPTKKEDVTRAQGGTCLEYDPTMPSKFLVGSEAGNIFSCSRRSKTMGEKIVSVFPAHLGPIYALQRNPFYPKNFLTVGDWSAKIWSEDGRESPIIWTPKYCEYLTGGCWSTTRPSVFFLTKDDGTVDVWDLLYKRKGPEYSIKVCEEPVCCISPQESGELVAVGTKGGSAVIFRLHRRLVELQRNERNLFSGAVDRAIRREKILENKERERKLALKKAQEPTTDVSKKEELNKIAEAIADAEKRFFEVVEKELKRIQQYQLKFFPAKVLIKDDDDGSSEHSSVGGGDSALPESMRMINSLMERPPKKKKHRVIAESPASQDGHFSGAVKRTSASDHPSASVRFAAEAESSMAEPDAAEHTATGEEQSTAVDRTAVLGHPTATEPTIAEPTITEPIIAEPNIAEPTIAEPTKSEPTITEPTIAEPTITEPTKSEPTITEPTIAEPTITEPTIAEPTIAEPTNTESTIAEPTIAEPINTESTIAEPIIAEPTIAEPTIAEPTIAEPTKSEPSIAEPTITEPIITEPIITEPTKSEPIITEPIIAESTIAEPTIAEPTNAELTIAEPTKSEPTITELTIAEPIIAEPTNAEPTNAEPTITELTSGSVEQHKASVEQPVEAEQSMTVEQSVVLEHVTTMLEQPARSEKSAIAESTIAEPDAVMEHIATVEQSVVVEHLTPVEHSDVGEHGDSGVLVHATVSEDLSTASKHSTMAESTTAELQHTIALHSASLEPEQTVGAEHLVTVEHSNADEHQSTSLEPEQAGEAEHPAAVEHSNADEPRSTND